MGTLLADTCDARAGKRARRNKKTARAFLIRAGILDKSGKGLSKNYR